MQNDPDELPVPLGPEETTPPQMAELDRVIAYLIVDPDGAILRSGTCGIDSLDLQAGPDQLLLLDPGGIADDTHYWDWDANAFAEYPPRPGIWAVWDGSEWIDPRTPADLAATLLEARTATSIDKSDLLIRMVMSGVLPPDDAEIAAGGIIPPTIQAALDVLPPEVFPPEAQMVARIKWRSDNIISRLNPVIVLAALALGITDAQMDAIFGVPTPE